MSRLEIVKSLARLQCTECGAEANASCNCGKPYVPAAIRVAEYDKATPGKSTRAAAADLGVSNFTVSKARQSGVSHLTPETVVGLDGKTYKAKSNAPKAIAAAPAPKTIAEPPPVTESVPDVIEEEEIADAAQIEDNIIHCMERVNHHVPMFKKHIKLSAFDREAKERISAAIDSTIQKLRSVQSVLAKNGGGK
jgi:hypothetical protein